MGKQNNNHYRYGYNEVKGAIDQLASQALRTIAIGSLKNHENIHTENEAEKDLTFMGFKE